MNDIIKSLENIANNLESIGFVKQATQIDIVSNTLEKEGFNLFGKPKGQPDDAPIDPKFIDLGTRASIHSYPKPDGHSSGAARFYTEQEPPNNLKDLFLHHTDGVWYLEADENRANVEEKSPGVFVVYKITRDKGTEVPGLTPDQK